MTKVILLVATLLLVTFAITPTSAAGFNGLNDGSCSTCLSGLASFFSFSSPHSEFYGIGNTESVYLATRKKDRKKYAVKVVKMDNPRSIMAKNEIKVLQSMWTSGFDAKPLSAEDIAKGKDNIIRYYRSYSYRGSYYIVLEYMSEGSVFDQMQRNKFVGNEKEVVHVVHEVLKGLHFLHTKNYVHRDIKPENILISSDHKIKLTNFGLTDSQQTFTEYYDDFPGGTITVERALCQDQKSCVGTPAFMAPEMRIPGSQDRSSKSDVWSLGMTALEMYIGPFTQSFYNDVIQRMHIQRTLSPLVDFMQTNPKFQHASNEFLDFFIQSLTYDVSDRPNSATLLNHKLFE